jgi:hypothetical protein
MANAFEHLLIPFFAGRWQEEEEKGQERESVDLVQI